MPISGYVKKHLKYTMRPQQHKRYQIFNIFGSFEVNSQHNFNLVVYFSAFPLKFCVNIYYAINIKIPSLFIILSEPFKIVHKA